MSEKSKKVADAVKPVLSDAIAAQAYAAILALPWVGPFFALPVVSHVTKFFLGKISAWAVQESAVGLSLLWIQVDLAYEVSSAEEARDKLQDMLNNPAKYSAAEQQKIDEYFDETTVELIQLGVDRLA